MIEVDLRLEDGEKTVVKEGKREILIVKLDGKYYAMNNKCTHLGCSLSDGEIKGDNVECPCHGSTFSIKTGKVVKGPAKKPETTFKVKSVKNKILIEVV